MREVLNSNVNIGFEPRDFGCSNAANIARIKPKFNNQSH